MEHEELTERIIGAAYAVYNALGSGFLESVYERALAIELNKTGLSVVYQHRVPVYYEGQCVGDFVADVIVEDSVIVELKSVERLAKTHEMQLVNYLVATGKPVGLLINFGPERVDIKRKVRTL